MTDRQEEHLLQDGSRIWLRGTLLQDPSTHVFGDGNRVVYLEVACGTGPDSMMKVSCNARGRLCEYCEAKGLESGDPIWVYGSVREKPGRDGNREAVVNVVDLTAQTAATWDGRTS